MQTKYYGMFFTIFLIFFLTFTRLDSSVSFYFYSDISFTNVDFDDSFFVWKSNLKFKKKNIPPPKTKIIISPTCKLRFEVG